MLDLKDDLLVGLCCLLIAGYSVVCSVVNSALNLVAYAAVFLAVYSVVFLAVY